MRSELVDLRETIETRRRRCIELLGQQSHASRRAAGVYYTPDYIVEYIVRSAVGPLLDGKTPRQASRLRILDLACGPGSFLSGIYRFLLDWHRDRYLEDGPRRWSEGRRPRLSQTSTGDWVLTLAERQRILLHGVFGIEVDPLAAEAARFALVLQMLDGAEAAGATLEVKSAVRAELVVARTLARLESNIRRGDALLDEDTLSGMIAACGRKFDAVVGNPPYRRERGFKHLLDTVANTDFGRAYRSPRMDLWYYFFHRALEVLRPGGVLSFIVSAYWASGPGAAKLVQTLRHNAHLDEIFLLDDLVIFPHVTGRHCIVRVVKQSSRRATRPTWTTRPTRVTPSTRVKRVPALVGASAEAAVAGKLPLIVFDKTAEELFRGAGLDLEPPADELLAKIERWSPLGKLGAVRQGIAENPASINARTNAAFGDRWRVGEGVFALRPHEVAALRLSRQERALLRPYYDLCDVRRHELAERPSLQLIYATRKTCPDIDRFPRLRRHLERFRSLMESRRETRQGANRWWHLHWPRDERIWDAPKLIVLQFATRPTCAVADRPAYVPFSMNVFVPAPAVQESLHYLCAVLNSRLLWKWHQHRAKRRGVGLEINGQALARSPIRRIDFARADERAAHDRIAALARAIAALARKHRTTPSAARRKALARQLETADGKLDRLIYGLYGLTDEEIALVEAATAAQHNLQSDR